MEKGRQFQGYSNGEGPVLTSAAEKGDISFEAKKTRSNNG